MKTITLSLLVLSTSLLGQNFKNAITETMTPNGWENSKRIFNNLNSDGSIKYQTFQNWSTTTWQNEARTSYTYNTGGLPTVTLYENYDAASSAWKFLNQKTTNYGSGTVPLSVLTETSMNGGSSFINKQNDVYVYNGGKLISIDTDKWSSSGWLDDAITLYDYNADGTVKAFTVQAWDNSTTSYVNSFRVQNTYSAGKLQLMHSQYWGNGFFVDFTRNTYTYNPTGDIDVLMFETYYETNAIWVKNFKDTYTYQNGRLNQKMTQHWDGSLSNWKDAARTTYTYDINVGVTEYALDSAEPVYFDLYGNRIEKRYNEVMIERSGSKVRKVIIRY